MRSPGSRSGSPTWRQRRAMKSCVVHWMFEPKVSVCQGSMP